MKLLIGILFILSISAQEKPAWLNNPKLICKKYELCAIGEGESRTIAMANATSNLAKFFSAQVNTKLSTTLESDNDEAYEQAKESIEIITKESLEGVEHKEFFDDGAMYYTVASINKRLLAQKIKKEISDYDLELSNESKNSPPQILKLKSVFYKRELLNQRYNLLTKFNINSPISYKEILSLQKKARSIQIHIAFDKNIQQTAQEFIKSKISSAGYSITAKKENANVTLSSDLTIKDLYFNTKGFKKKMYSFKISRFKKEKTSSQISEDFIIVARNDEQANEKFFMALKDYLDNSLGKLNFGN